MPKFSKFYIYTQNKVSFFAFNYKQYMLNQRSCHIKGRVYYLFESSCTLSTGMHGMFCTQCLMGQSMACFCMHAGLPNCEFAFVRCTFMYPAIHDRLVNFATLIIICQHLSRLLSLRAGRCLADIAMPSCRRAGSLLDGSSSCVIRTQCD